MAVFRRFWVTLIVASAKSWAQASIDNGTKDVAALATTLGQGEGQLWRKLAGKNPTGVLDLCLWAWLVGDDEAIAGVTRAFANR